MFTEENKPLLGAAAAIDFQLMKNGVIDSFKHNPYERGLYFIQKAIELNGNMYGYSKVKYLDAKLKVTIRCSIHGDFEQLPNNHLRGNKCPNCKTNLKMTTASFIQKAKLLHGDLYDYSLVNYVNNTTKVIIRCHEHDDYVQEPRSHLNGAGCPACGGTTKLSLEDFIAKAAKAHNDIYDYSQVEYINARSKVRIRCTTHGLFEQTPDNHIRGNGCPHCAGKNHDILYLLKCLETGWYKIGITTNNTKKRISDLGGNLEEVHHVKLEDPRKYESILHNKYKDFNKYHEVVRSGKTEFFSLTENQVQEVIDYMNEVSKIA